MSAGGPVEVADVLHRDEHSAWGLAALALVGRGDGPAPLTRAAVELFADACGVSTRAVCSSLGSKQALLTGLGTRAFDVVGDTVAELPVTDDRPLI
jgi:hypothetical protein